MANESRVASLAAMLRPDGDLAKALAEALHCARTNPGSYVVSQAIEGALDALGELQRVARGVQYAPREPPTYDSETKEMTEAPPREPPHDQFRKAVADALETTIREAMSVDLDPVDVARDVSLRVTKAIETAIETHGHDQLWDEAREAALTVLRDQQ